jgi:hypothetical protein
MNPALNVGRYAVKTSSTSSNPGSHALAHAEHVDE